MKRSELRADPAKTQDWQQRSRKKRTTASSGFITSDPQRGGFRATNPQFRRGKVKGLRGFTQRVFTLYGKRCVVCGKRAVEAHHVVPLGTLFARGEDVAIALGGDARNGVPVDRDCHAAHENASRRIRRSELPAGVIEWAREHDFGWLIDDGRIYPA